MIPHESERGTGSVRLPAGVIGRAGVLDALDRNLASLAESGRRFVLLEGPTGIGKSTVLREMRRRVLAAGGLVAAGEFGAAARRGPSSGLRGAIGDIVGTMLGLPDEELNAWLFDLRQALGGQVEEFADLIPEFGLLSEPGTETPGASPIGLRNRLRVAVLAVVRATARPTRPLMITLDDIDRADAESLQIVHDVVTGDADGLLVLGAAHPDTMRGQPLLDDPTADCIPITELDRVELDLFVGAALGAEPGSVHDLASLIVDQVGANPLGVVSFLQRAASEGALARPDSGGDWTWNIASMRALDPTPSDAQIATSVLREFDDAAVLEVAACIGESFTITDLAHAADRSSDEVAETILNALDRGILRRRATAEPGSVFLDPNDAYVFAHERVAEVLRAHVSPEAEAAVHERCGRALLDSEIADDVVNAARHLNAAFTGAESAEARMELAALNARAAGRARQTAAFVTARELAEAGLASLPADADARDHDLTLGLHLAAAEAAWITGDLPSMHALINTARSLDTTVIDRAEIAFLEMKGLVADERLTEALAVGRDALADLGIGFPAQPKRHHAVRDLLAVQRRLRRSSDEELLELPNASDATTIVTQNVLSEMYAPSVAVDPDLWPLVVLRSVRLTLEAGRVPTSPIAFGAYGLLLGVLGRYETAQRFGDLALRMAEQPECREHRPWTKFFFYNFINHWTRPAADAIEPMRDAIREALSLGDLETAGFMTAVELYQSFLYGVPLPEIDARAAELAVYLRPYPTQFRLCEQTHQYVQNVMGLAPDALVLAGETAYDERREVPAAVARGDMTMLSGYHLSKLGLLCFFGDFEGAVHHADEAEPYLDGVRGTPNIPLFHAVSTLARLRAAPNAATTRRALRRARRGFRAWRKHAPMNYEQLAILIDAEAARAAGKYRDAEKLYDECITVAERSGTIMAAALAREYCGDLHALQGRDRIARAYLTSAVEAWSSTGGDGKVAQLRRDYPDLIASTPAEPTDADARSVLELTNTIVADLGFDEMVEQLLATIIRVTDAERGVLFLDDGPSIVPRVVFEHGVVSQPRLVDIPYAASVVRYVERSDRPVLITDTAASVHGRDAHIHSTGIQSVMCIPLSRGGVQRALVYVESTQLGAFTPAHMETLRMLSAHIATALENMHLVDRLAEALRSETELVFAQSRFIPRELLSELGHETLVAIDAGDAVAREMTILYTDIRGYTLIQEGLDPRHGIGFLNDYLRRMEPPIVAHGGFVVSYVGDGMIALFGPSSDGALRAALAMRRIEREVSEERRARGLDPVRTGIALHTGTVVIGTFGGVNQLRCGVVGDTVNLASRIEGLTRDYAPLLVSETAFAALNDPGAYDLRRVGRFRVVGRDAPVTAWEAFDEDDPEVRSAKRSMLDAYDTALKAFEAGNLQEALDGFDAISRVVADDKVANGYITRCRTLLDTGIPDDWDGVITRDHK